MALSPDEKYILTGTSYDRINDKSGSLRIFDTASFEQKATINTGESGVVEV